MKALSIEDHREEVKKSQGETTEEVITISFEDDPTRMMQIGSHLTTDDKDRPMTFLQTNKDIFAGSTSNMPGILSDVIVHN